MKVVKASMFLAMTTLMFFATTSAYGESTSSLIERETLTDNWFGFGGQLEEQGVTFELALTQIYQRNTRGGLNTHRRSGELSGSYDAGLGIDLEPILGWEGGTIAVGAEGSWCDGIDGPAVGSVFGVNDDAGGDRTLDVSEVFFEQTLFDDQVIFRVGKIDLGGGFECRSCPVAFDTNSYANCSSSQFLNSALGNNPTIPFPDNGLGAALYVHPIPGFYVAAGVADAEADARETGFNTAFHGDDYFFSVYEAGFVPVLNTAKGELRGAYRFGMWYDPQPKARFDGTGNERDDIGWYMSADQAVWKERDTPEDEQGLGVFLRYGLADKAVNPVRMFWSTGAQYRGLIPWRNDDVLAFGVARGSLVGGAGFTADHETAYEAYYNIAAAGWLTLTPSVQVVEHPGGVRTGKSAVIAGVRAQLAF